MARNTSVSLGEHFTQFIEQQVASGRYATASDVIRAGLRILEDDALHVESLRNALIEGEQSGPGRSLDLQAFLSRQRETLAQ